MEKVKSICIGMLVIIACLIAIPQDVTAGQRWCPPHGVRPYGDYCRGPGPHGRYGAKQIVRSPAEARTILEEYFKGRTVVIGPVTEKKWFFRAEILDQSKNLIDIVIIDKRTGRIRSIL